MRNRNIDMFHDEAAHNLERRFALLAGAVFAIGILYWTLYHAVF